jgi:hypothetical protein
MTRSRYRIFEDFRPHFCTCTIVGWLPIFNRHRGENHEDQCDTEWFFRRHLSSIVENRQPHRRLIRRRPFNPMLPVCRDVEPIAGRHIDYFVLESQPGGTLEE